MIDRVLLSTMLSLDGFADDPGKANGCETPVTGSPAFERCP